VKIRILFLTNRFAPGGAETFLLNRIGVLDRSRFEPYAAALRAGGKLRPAFERAGIPTFELGEGVQFDPASIKNLYGLIKREGIHIVEAHVWWSCIVGRVVARAAGVPVVVTNEQEMHSGATAHRADVRYTADLTTRLSDACVHITRASMASFQEETPRVLQGGVLRRRIPNGIDARKIADTVARTDRRAKRASLGLPEDAFVIGNVGRLVPAKGQTYLLEAFAQVLQKVPQARLVIVGWGDLDAALKAQAKELGIADRVCFTGARLDVPEVLATFDVFGFASIHEAQGIAILEGMAAGIPVVAPAIDGIPDVVKHEHTGLAVPPRDPAALAAAILRLHDEPELGKRLVPAARALFEEEFSIEAAGRAYETLYLELLDRAGIPVPPAAHARPAAHASAEALA
jgi:glycosyltransferase involved in cell wall biosynthesis